MNKVLLAYVPFPHEGYRQVFVQNPLITRLYLFGTSLIERFDPLAKDIRALSPHLARESVRALGIFKEVLIADESTLEALNRERAFVVMPDEDVCHEVAKKFLPECRTEFIRFFLRWDTRSVLAEAEVPCDEVIKAGEFAVKMMKLALNEAQKSPDWWRQIGAVAVKNGEVLIAAFNQHLPSPNHILAFGDPRANFKKGVHIELSPALHAEAGIVAWAASRSDVNLEGADLYVTTFPCPSCARIIAYSGIKRLFFLEGYSVYDGAEVLRSRGVKLIRLEM